MSGGIKVTDRLLRETMKQVKQVISLMGSRIEPYEGHTVEVFSDERMALSREYSGGTRYVIDVYIKLPDTAMNSRMLTFASGKWLHVVRLHEYEGGEYLRGFLSSSIFRPPANGRGWRSYLFELWKEAAGRQVGEMIAENNDSRPRFKDAYEPIDDSYLFNDNE